MEHSYVRMAKDGDGTCSLSTVLDTLVYEFQPETFSLEFIGKLGTRDITFSILDNLSIIPC
jgi:hypothetical protein